MSDHGFHVHGPHDHELEHAAEHGGKDRFAGMIAVVTAIIATIGAIFSYMGGATQAEAALFKNDQAIKQTLAADQWALYQSRSTKQAIAELARDLAGEDKKAALQAKVERYDKEKAETMAEARALEAEAKEWGEKSEHQLHLHHRWAQATTALQIAIALGAIALLSRRVWLQWAMFGVAGIGLALGGMALAHV
jgi:hypothetical protein